MTPAEHAATVREALDQERHLPNGQRVRDPHDALDALLVFAERASLSAPAERGSSDVVSGSPTEHAATVREALENCSRWTAQEDFRYQERDRGLAALVALAERATELQRDVHAAWEVARAQCERAERAESALRVARAALGETAP